MDLVRTGPIVIVFHESTRAGGGVGGNSNIKSILWLYSTHNTTQLITAQTAQVTFPYPRSLPSLGCSDYEVW